MIRVIVFAALAVASTPNQCEDLTIGVASQPDRHSQRYIERLATATKLRFVAAANVSGCRQDTELYAFNQLRDQLTGLGQSFLDDAAAKGLAEGRSVADSSGSAACQAAIDKLSAADDGLLVLSEQAASDR